MTFFHQIATRAVRLPKLALPALLASLTLTANVLSSTVCAADPPAHTNAIPLDQIGAVAGKQYSGDGLAIEPCPDGALLRCVFQRLNGHATEQGLWLTSTKDNAQGQPFQIIARTLGRASAEPLPHSGQVQVTGNTARFIRLRLTEEYSVSMDGLQQDFVIAERPPGQGALQLELEVNGAKSESIPGGAKLVLDDDGRSIVYNRLKAVDARGKQLPVKLEALTTNRLALILDDASAQYPVRIDPTFTDANWISLGAPNGVSGGGIGIDAIAADSSGNVYVGGDFTNAGGIAANHIAEWNGSSWSALASGIAGGNGDGSAVYALAVSGSNLYVGGIFTEAGGVSAYHIALWNGNSWSAFGSGIGGGPGESDPSLTGVYALAVSGSNVYAGGYFETAGGLPATNIALWNGISWSALGSGLGNGEYTTPVSALAVSGSNLYAGGGFTTGGSVSVSYIAQWNGITWSPLGSGMNGPVPALAVLDGNLYAGGAFTTAGGASINYIAQWNGSSWSAADAGIPGGVSVLAVSGTNLYAGGGFGAAQWNGSSWLPLDSGAGGFRPGGVLALAGFGTNLYAGGNFTTGGFYYQENGIAKWNGSSWLALGSGIYGYVNALAASGGNLYVGGDFTSAAANDIVQWNGSTWAALGSGFNSEVEVLAVSGSTLYAGGQGFISQWNGSAWSPLGSGLAFIDGYPFNVDALAVSGSNLYVGGLFFTAGGVSANYIAQWNGTNWSPVGSELDGPVGVLAVSGSTLYAGSQGLISQWNGNGWSALGSGINGNGSVSALAVSGSILYAGGSFTNMGGIAAIGIAQWNGTNWSPLGSGMAGGDDLNLSASSVSALVVSGGTLYAGGNFTNAGGIAANYIAQWNGTNWSALGSGISGEGSDGQGHNLGTYVSALAASGGTMYVGGAFTMAGTNVSPYVAEAILAPTITGISSSPGGPATLSFTSVPESTNQLWATTNLSLPFSQWQAISTTIAGPNGSIQFIDTNTTGINTKFYRLSLP